ncbi:Glycosyltransferase involved in cell wall bisynthesis [Paraburkholderia fungorum]|uniref:Glycosyltransferase involved in cell wall bisynthesis n=1 Tax=Paraburkholderia fungorum TaxID=134537 RepID=A0A1H1HFJ5_9BURK|nr:glycosyltransferase [Paraburkholderia fungorum]SDR24231.1 Glycosyltransferase involved in cell wall bisynthesis [Paraburkholderia fungorum]
MKILHVMESTATGTLSIVCTIANRLAREGNEVYVIYSVRDNTPKDLTLLFHPNVILRRFQMRDQSIARTLIGLRREICGLSPDIVHLHSSFAGFLGRLSTLFCLRSTVFFYSPHCISFMRADVRRTTKLCFAALEWLACAKKCLYIGCSESECLAIRRYLRRRAVLVENAVDDAILARGSVVQTEARRSGARRIVTVAGIRKQKNPALFAQIACLLERKNLEILWIGDGDPDATRLLRDAGVEVTGWLSRDAALERVGQADVFLSTSSWEGMPVSVIEAMALGTPVVASRCAGNVDTIRHLETGLVFDSATEAAELLSGLLDNEELGLAIATRAMIEARERFSEDRFFREVTSLYAAQPQGRGRELRADFRADLEA